MPALSPTRRSFWSLAIALASVALIAIALMPWLGLSTRVAVGIAVTALPMALAAAVLGHRPSVALAKLGFVIGLTVFILLALVLAVFTWLAWAIGQGA